MEYKINGFYPESLFHYFEDISAIPRGSGNEKAVSEFLLDFAARRGLWCHTDTMHNVVIKKPGCGAGEKSKPVMLQGHLDMVCEKNSETVHDFLHDGIELELDGNILSANGTTLGADNGIAVAIMMALLDSSGLVHPPLECVFTTQEETGLYGAAALDASQLDARTMINLDSHQEGVGVVSCAGGLSFAMRRTPGRETVECAHLLTVSVSGLYGGHSGGDIHLGRANANKLAARILYHTYAQTDLRLVSVSGGSKENAIPREAHAVIAFPTEEACRRAKSVINLQEAAIRGEYLAADPGFRLSIKEETAHAFPVMDRKSTEETLSLLYLVPNGVLSRDAARDFVVTSVNLGVIRADTNGICLQFAPRSSVTSLQEETKSMLTLLAQQFGFTHETSGEYPGWTYEEHSPVREVFAQSYRRLFGKEMEFEAFHAGMECGLFSAKLPGLDAISVSPDYYDAHTTTERVDLSSCERTWSLLLEVLKQLASAQE